MNQSRLDILETIRKNPGATRAAEATRVTQARLIAFDELTYARITDLLGPA